MAAVPQTNLLPPGRADTPEGTVVNPGAPAGYIDAKKFGRITRSISNINKNLSGITSLLQQDLVQDQQAQVQEDKRQKQRVDNIKKDKKENFIEGAIQNTITKPVQKMAKKAKSAFGGFFKALTMIFAGWLLDKGGKALAAFQAGDTKTLENIRDNVLKAFGVAGGIFLLLNGGIPLIFSAVTSLIGTIITTIPAILALLANPAVWIAAGVLGAGIALGKFFSDPDNYESETTKNIRDSVRERGTADTLADLQKELEEAQKKRSEINLLKDPLAIKDYLHLGTVIAELKENISAVEQGYEGKNDPNFRAGLPPKKSVAADFAGFLGAKTFEQPISQEQRTAFAQMAQVSRQLGENMKKQEELQEKLSNTQDAGQQTTIKAELKLLKEEALTLNQQNKGLGKGLSGPQQALVLSLGLKTFEEIEGRPFSKGDEMSSDTLFKLGGRFDQVAAHDFVVPGTRINEYGQQSDKPSSGDLSMFADDDKSLEATLAREEAGLQKALENEKASKPPISSAQNNSLDLVKQPFKKESKVTLVPFDYQKDASGYEGDENYREGEASGIPDLMTSNPDNAYLLHFRSVYGIGK